jgi:putative addiction module CopG family antidote
MSKSYSPGDDADEIIARQVAKGNFTSADAVVKAAVRMLEEFEADVAHLRSRIDEADAAFQRGEFRKSPGAEAMKADIISRGEARLGRKS